MEHNDSLQHIQVLIAGRLYPMRIRQGEAEKVQHAATWIENKLNEYQRTYAGKDKQDYLAMCLLMLAVEYDALKTDSARYKNSESEELLEINRLLDAVIS
jgi:cell division protein ZapA